MVSEEEISRGLVEILCVPQNGVGVGVGGGGGGGVSSLDGVVEQLSAKLGLDLSHKSAFIANQINILRHFNSPPQPQPQSQLQLSSPFHGHPFSLHGNPFSPHGHPSNFVPQYYYHQQDQQQHQQHHVLPSPFTLHFGSHVTSPQPHVSYSQQDHVTAQTPVKDVKASKDSSQSGTKKRGGSGGLNKLCGVSPLLQAIVGKATMSRTEIVRELWVYIRKNNLQDPSNKRKIVCDEALRAVLETDCTDMFKMNKLLSKHILPLGPTKESDPPKRQKLDVESGSLDAETDSLTETPKSVEVAKSAETSDGSSLVIISDALASFVGTTRREMLASEAIQHVCEYVKVNGLEDPNSLIVNCDEKLKELLGCERISKLEINETLTRRHLLQSS